jgi:hypothetical protein
MLGDQVGGVLGDELIPLHRFDKGILPLVQACRQAVERSPERANFTAAFFAG